MKRGPKSFQVKDDPCVAEIYANKLIAASFDGGAVVLTLGVSRFAPPGGADCVRGGSDHRVHVTARLAISPVGAVEVVSALNRMINTLSQRQRKSATPRSN